ncbi:MAG: hypothetical protein ACE5J9_06320 [Methanosarcinales archaeon]
MTETISINIEVPKEIVEYIDNLTIRGLYKDRSEFFVDASLKQMSKPSEIKRTVELYLKGDLKKSENAYENIRRMCKELISTEEWREEFGNRNLDEVMDEMRCRK